MLDETGAAPEQPVPPSAPFVRQDIWLLQPEGPPFHPIVLAYADAVAVLKQNAGPSPHRWWRHQTQVHGLSPDPRDGLRNQCQHNTWFFLPWHRMCLFFFESICRTIIQGHPGVPETIKATWALPYWDYDRTDSRLLPPAFRAEATGCGRSGEQTPAPARIPSTRGLPGRGSPSSMPAAVVRPSAAATC
jgi:tyrosinase